MQIRDKDGEVIGAVGVTGDTEDNDEELAVHGIHAAGLKTDDDCPGALDDASPRPRRARARSGSGQAEWARFRATAVTALFIAISRISLRTTACDEILVGFPPGSMNEPGPPITLSK